MLNFKLLLFACLFVFTLFFPLHLLSFKYMWRYKMGTIFGEGLNTKNLELDLNFKAAYNTSKSAMMIF